MTPGIKPPFATFCCDLAKYVRIVPLCRRTRRISRAFHHAAIEQLGNFSIGQLRNIAQDLFGVLA